MFALTVDFDPRFRVVQQVLSPPFTCTADDPRAAVRIAGPGGCIAQESPADATLILTRPSFADGPVFYRIGAGSLFAAGSLDGLRQLQGDPLELDPELLPEFLLYRCVLPPYTLCRGVRQLRVGQSLRFGLQNGKIAILARTEWQPPPPSRSMPVGACADRLRDGLAEGIRALPVDDNVLLFSGGLDSSILAALARRCHRPLRLVSAGYAFEDPALDTEGPYAASAARDLDLPCETVRPDLGDYLAHVVRATAKAGQPVHHLQSALVDAVASRLEKGSRLVTGLGAGGLFGNFRNLLYWYRKPAARALAHAGMADWIGRLARRAGRGSSLAEAAAQGDRMADLADDENPIWSWHAYGDAGWIAGRFGLPLQRLRRTQVELAREFDGRDVRDIWALYALLGDETVTHDIWCGIVAASGSALIAPFYDPPLLEDLAGVAWSTRLHAPRNALRRELALKCGVPRGIVQRRKSGFGIRSPAWYGHTGVLAPLVRAARQGTDLVSAMNWDRPTPAQAHTLWAAVTLGIWTRIVLHGESADAIVEEIHAG